MMQSTENVWMDEWIVKTYFIGPLWLLLGVQQQQDKNQINKNFIKSRYKA